jgi:CRP-like cAMP-binding protein
MSATSQQLASSNRLLAALPRAEVERLAPALERVTLQRKTVLYDVGDDVRYAYFVLNGMISLLSVTSEDEAIEAGAIGSEGLVGIPTVLPDKRAPLRTTVQVSGSALRIEAKALEREFNRCERLRTLMLGYTHSLSMQIAQLIACNRYHQIEERLCRWLLMTSDRVRSNSFDLTHEDISYMLGTPRSGVTRVAGSLQDAGWIRYRRGKIMVLDREGLREKSCACYGVIKENEERFLAD